MALKPIELNVLKAALAPKKSAQVKKAVDRRPPPPHNGPLYFSEKAADCASRGCTVSTYIKVQKTPYCHTHAMRALAAMLIKLEVDANPCPGCGNFYRTDHPNSEVVWNSETDLYDCKYCGTQISSQGQD